MTADPGDLQVIVGERRTGRTSRLLRWLRDGHPIDSYPRWSRILVCAHADHVPTVHRLAFERYGQGPWSKSVFSVADLRSAWRGAIRPGTVEYAVDDADALMWSYLGVNQLPSLLTLCGRIFEGAGDGDG